MEYVDKVVDNDGKPVGFPLHENGYRTSEAEIKRKYLYTIMFGDNK